MILPTEYDHPPQDCDSMMHVWVGLMLFASVFVLFVAFLVVVL